MKHSVTNRIIIGKSIGFVVGGLVFFLFPMFGIALDMKFGLGLWLFYILMGVLTGLMGIMDHHPMFKFKMPFWFRGIVIGLSMHLMLILVTYDQMAALTVAFDVFGMQAPWWCLIDGAILGLIMGWVETKFAGEGNLPLE